MTRAVPVADVRVEGRHRRDLGDVSALAASIREVGLIHPVAVTADLRLVAGQRRLEAARLLGWQTVPVTVVASLVEAADLLRAEADENTQRKPFTPTEAEAIASAIEAALRPVAAARRAAAIKDRDEKGRALSTSAESAEVERQPETRDIAAQAVGYGRDTISKVRKVKDLAEDEETPEPVREAARWALGEMDATGSVAGPHHRVMCAVEAEAAPKPHPGVTKWLESSQELKDKGYMVAFYKVLKKSGEMFQFDPERVGRLGDERDVEVVEHQLKSTQKFLDKMRAARSGLRLIKGDQG
ncbi:ParB domain protein nuclease [Segniliparus rotundus DSM 44985]|uniref:ParB domain protein nuclease n=1 Tax=Segniliparus rotundus (strain ATCC BAA-972 / CDC 1076 / CIP 108378 / DSM 44985 / JCM 13578) TaxID=640132 RepID=D6Z9J5_SEGRD|nr:ParB N-terminal domain-containing protein [Segniliparus rotundus]ADG96522.1 ParB domain protein nuclease [Segniliparus rotundus DSM 44985]